MQLRYYQEEAIASIYGYFAAKGGNPIVVMPTGTGKSLVIAAFVKKVLHDFPGQRILMLTHVKELIEQNFSKLMAVFPTAPAGIYSAGLGRRDTAPITYAGIASVHSNPAMFGHIDLVLIDECHMVSPKQNTMYQSFLNGLESRNPQVKVIGFTATDYRLGVGRLSEAGGLFSDVCYDISGYEAFNRLVAEGYLAPLVTKKTGMEYDVSGVRVSGGELVANELQAAVDKEYLTYAAVEETVAVGHDRKHWLVFSSGIEHALHIRDALRAQGITAEAVHSKMSGAERDAIISGFKAGAFRALVNNGILTTGFDFPALDLLAIMRPTMSTGLWVQILGRGTRPSPGKDNCLVLDFAGNTRRLGPINDPVIPKRKGKKGGGTAPVRCCENCGSYCHASLTVCPDCGAEFPRQIKIHAQAAVEEVMKTSDMPVIETVPVDRVSYAVHSKPGGVPTLKVEYYCGLRRHTEWVCLEHTGYPQRKAQTWWRERSDTPPPTTIAEAMERFKELGTPSAIRLWSNKKPYPEIIGTVVEKAYHPTSAIE